MICLTWNLEYATPKGKNLPIIKQRIAEADPDVVCYTEVLRETIPDGHTIEADADYGYRNDDGQRRKVILWSKQPWTGIDVVGDPRLPTGRYASGVTGGIRFIGICIPWPDAHVRTGRKDRERREDHITYCHAKKGDKRVSPRIHDFACKPLRYFVKSSLMPRKIRIEYPGAIYHVINRGNFRSWIFDTPGARKSFLGYLRKVCDAKGWTLHAWCLMGNHYHLCLQTKEANLVEGMKWLQSVFANNFNRFRKQNGHVFQGRYKAILLDGSAVGPVCHYIHLNPVRAGIVQCGDLQTYRQSSFHRLWKPSARWPSEDFSMCLQSAGNLVDKPAGRHSYRDYLGWLSEEEEEMKKLGFEKMLKGWAKGSEGFKQSIMGQLNPDKVGKIVEAEASGLKTAKYEKLIPGLLSLLGKEECDISKDRKGDGWKVATARYLRDRHLAPNGWIAERLGMGKASSVQSLVSRHKKIPDGQDLHWEKMKNHGILD